MIKRIYPIDSGGNDRQQTLICQLLRHTTQEDEITKKFYNAFPYVSIG